MHPNLVEYIRRYISITDAELELFHSYLKPRTIKKKEHVLLAGETCKTRYYITRGVLRLYYINNKEKEQILHFGIDNWWISDYESLVNQTPSKLYIQATEDTELLELHTGAFEKLCVQLPKAERLFRIIMEKTFVASQKRIEYMMSLTGEESYETFISSNLAFAQRVPQYMLASYLGMTPEFFSKLRGKISS